MNHANVQPTQGAAARNDVVVRSRRTGRAEETRELILAVAERLFAQHGVVAISNRQISDAAGQGNNTAVGYHFGTKTDLVRAIVGRHSEQVEGLRQQLLERQDGGWAARDWVACLVRPVTDHLATLGGPTWYARFLAQVLTDPALRRIVIDDALTAPPMQATIDGLCRSLPDLPQPIRAERNDMARNLIVHMCAERERAMADGTSLPGTTWETTASGLIDAIVGLLLAPVTRT